jgi:hypothetical protein
MGPRFVYVCVVDVRFALLLMGRVLRAWFESPDVVLCTVDGMGTNHCHGCTIVVVLDPGCW